MQMVLGKGFEGYIRVAEAAPHPEALDIAKKLNVETMMNVTIRKKLGLSTIGEKHFNISPAKALEKYFGEYSVSAKAYRTKDIPNPFFQEVAKFLLDVLCVHVNAYRMSKQKAGIIVETFEGRVVVWGVITGPALKVGLYAYQARKKL